MRTKMIMVLMVATVFITGCPPTTPPPSEPPAEAVLEGDWVGTAADGEEFTLTFNDQGVLTQIETTLDDGSVVTLTVTDSTSMVDGSEVTVEVQGDNQSATYTGTLSANENRIDGTVSRTISITDNVTVTLPAGEFDVVRVGADACEGVTCDPGEECMDGECVAAADPCEGVMCDEGETCVDGQCVADDPCEGVMCDEGETCVDGQCVADDPCEGVMCDEGEMCVDGACVPTMGTGDPVNGAAVYATTCMVCHGENGGGGAIGPNIQGAAAAQIEAAVNGEGGHPPYEVTAQEILDLEAYLGDF